MPAFVALLRAVNLGGRNAVPMTALAELCGDLGLAEVKTVLQSGNVVFRSRSSDRGKLSSMLGDAIEKRCGFRPALFLRSHAELREVIAANPFPQAAARDPGHLLVIFFDGKPAPGAAKALSNHGRGPERVELSGKNLYAWYTEGVGRSKLTNAFLEKALGQPGTGRNWNTVSKLEQICGSLEQKRSAAEE